MQYRKLERLQITNLIDWIAPLCIDILCVQRLHEAYGKTGSADEVAGHICIHP